jgi:hypothetical protein
MMIAALDVFAALPFLLIVVLLLTLFGRSLPLLLAAIAGAVWTDLARVAEDAAAGRAAWEAALTAAEDTLLDVYGEMLDTDRLVAAGANLRYHGDLDPVGLDITAQVVRRTQAQPWRMGVGDYEAAVRPDAPTWTPRVALRSPWDPALAARMAEVGRPVFEEQVVETLLADLAAARR